MRLQSLLCHDRRGRPGQAQLHTHKLPLPALVMNAAALSNTTHQVSLIYAI